MTADKIDNHYFQQLSALVDGDLPPDQARFLLRRMQHDAELTGCLERWQLFGDVLRGQAGALAPPGFVDRIAAAIATEPLQSAAASASARSRGSFAKWGGGALAASIAAIALFMVRQQVPDETPAPAAPTVASREPVGEEQTKDSGASGLQGAATATAASVAVASVPRRQNNVRRSATRTQQAARKVTIIRDLPERAVASASVLPVVHSIAGTSTGNGPRDPFSNVQINTQTVRPWPRAVLPQYSGSGAFNTDYSTDRAGHNFYPFEPRFPESPPVAPPVPAARD